MKRAAALLALSLFALVATSAVAAPPSASLQISHFVRGCHIWSLNGGAYHVNQVIHLTRGGSLRLALGGCLPWTGLIVRRSRA